MDGCAGAIQYIGASFIEPRRNLGRTLRSIRSWILSRPLHISLPTATEYQKWTISQKNSMVINYALSNGPLI